MNKTKTYFTILIASVAVAAAGYVMNIGQIKSFVSLCLSYAGNNILATSAAVCTFIFLGSKNYWFVLLGCAVAAALLLQFMTGGHGAGITAALARVTTFLSIAFLMNLIKLVINK